MSWVIIKTERTLWTVGHYSPEGNWWSLADFDSARDAAIFIHFLNGGTLAPADLDHLMPPDYK